MATVTMRSMGTTMRIAAGYKKINDNRKKDIDKREVLWHTHHIK